MTVWSWTTSSWRWRVGDVGEGVAMASGFGVEQVVAVAGDGEEGDAGGLVEGG